MHLTLQTIIYFVNSFRAAFSRATQVIAWRDLQEDRMWRQGWD